MTIAKDFASKAAIAFVAFAMIFTMFAPAAQAQSTEDLQAQINTLLAQIAALSASSTTSSGSAVCPYTWTRDLNVGATGADVMKLQQFLNANADTRVAASGAGSVGMETETYGPATAAAVSKMQVMYRAEILTPAGLVNPTGYFGASSRAKANALCATTSTTPTTPVEGGEEEEEAEAGELSGEADLDAFEIEDGESTVEEGDTDVVIAELTIEFADGDASISRLDVALDGETGAEAWDAFDTLSLWVDGEMVAEMDASSEDDYLDENAGEIRFSGLDIVAMEDEEVEVLIGASVQNNLDTEELGDWTAEVTSMRFFDADGVATTEDDFDELGAGNGNSSFEIQVAGTDEEINVSLSSSNPDATDVVVDTDTDTNDVTIMVADIEAEDNDIDLNTIVVKIDTTNGTTTDVVDEVRVVIDGESFDAESIGTLAAGKSEANGTTSVWYLFDIDGDVVVEEDGEVSMEVVVDLNDTDDAARYPNGTTIKASVTSVETAEWDAEGAEDLNPSTQIGGTAVGDQHTLVAEGILVPVDGFSSTVDTLGDNDTIGEFTLEFEVTAVEGDFYITELASAASTSPSNGVGYTVTGGAATVTASLTSTADEDSSGVFTVREGETETFTLVVTVDPAAAGTYRVSLDEVWYSALTTGLSGDAYVPTPVSDYRTATKSINQ
jgi:hypothetical protein